MSTKGSGKTVQWLRDHVDYNADYCLVWPFSRNPNGYGQLGYLGRTQWAHRLMCEFAHGPAPSPDYEVAHSCGNGHGGCANPKHLSWKTKADNRLDCWKHGTQARQFNGSRGRLTDDQVEGIRALKGKKPQAEIAAIFGVSEPTVRDIFLGRSHTGPSKIQFFTDAEDARIRELHALGMNWSEMGRDLNRPASSISRRGLAMGLKQNYDPKLDNRPLEKRVNRPLDPGQ